MTGPTTFHTFDPQGNVCQRLNSSAQVTATDTFDAFGQGYRTPGTVTDVYGFGAQWGYYHDWDTPLGLLPAEQSVQDLPSPDDVAAAVARHICVERATLIVAGDAAQWIDALRARFPAVERLDVDGKPLR